jgi:hypothetical protein
MITIYARSVHIHEEAERTTYILGTHLLSLHVRLTCQALITSQLAKTLCATVQDVRRARLWEEKEQEDQTEA